VSFRDVDLEAMPTSIFLNDDDDVMASHLEKIILLRVGKCLNREWVVFV